MVTKVTKKVLKNKLTGPFYNGKVVCIDLCNCNKKIYTVGKIYQFVDGKITTDEGCPIPFYPIHSFEEWVSYSDSKFIEIKE